MAFRLHAPHPDVSDESEHSEDQGSSSEEDEADLTWEDWVSDSMTKLTCKSLFDDTVFSSTAEALAHDKSVHGVDLDQTCSRLSEFTLFGRSSETESKSIP